MPRSAPPPFSNEKKGNNNILIFLIALALIVSIAAFILSYAGQDSEPTVQAISTTQQVGSSVGGINTNTLRAPSISSSEEQARISAVQKVIQSSVTIEVGSSFGSGFFYAKDGNTGLIMTAAHVVTDATTGEAAKTVSIGITMGTEIAYRVQGQVIGVDERRDIAAIRINTDVDFEIADLALDKQVQLGQTVIAIGGPFRLENTVTAGVVSHLNRTISDEGTGNVLGFNLIQTDTPINSGNSGGALVNLDGEVVGINILIQTGTAQATGNVGIGFAVPINQAKEVVDSLLRGEIQDSPAYLGISGRTSNIGRSGAYVATVDPGEAADMAGIKVEDLIIEADGMPITSFVDLLTVIRLHSPGDSVELKVIRPPTEEVATEQLLTLNLILGTPPTTTTLS